VLAAGGAKRTRLAKLASASNIDQEQRVDEEHQMRITKISRVPSQSEVLTVALA
jgi:hypothetical protein